MATTKYSTLLHYTHSTTQNSCVLTKKSWTCFLFFFICVSVYTNSWQKQIGEKTGTGNCLCCWMCFFTGANNASKSSLIFTNTHTHIRAPHSTVSKRRIRLFASASLYKHTHQYPLFYTRTYTQTHTFLHIHQIALGTRITSSNACLCGCVWQS